MDLIAALNWRYAVKAFSNDSVSDADLQTLLEALRLSASSYGLQPYKVLVIKSKRLRESLVSVSYGQEKVAQASHLIVLAIDLEIGPSTVAKHIRQQAKATGQSLAQLTAYSDYLCSVLADKTEAQKIEWAHQQAYIALGNLLTSAALLAIDACPMSGFDAAGYDRVLGLHALGLTASVICPIGYRHSQDIAALRPKVRPEFGNFVVEL